MACPAKAAPHPSLPRDPRVKPGEGRVREGASDAKDAQRPRDVLQALLADVLEAEVETARRIFANARGDADPARLSQTFDPGGDVDAVAKNVAVLDENVPGGPWRLMSCRIGRNTQYHRLYLDMTRHDATYRGGDN
jgi:hypothetical protein